MEVIGGVDTHQDLHHAAVIDRGGEILATMSFSTTRAGYRAMLTWFRSHGQVIRVGVEQTGSYGAGLTRHLAIAGIPVLEVTGPDPALRRSKGKDDTLDAIAAAKTALTGQRVSVAKDRRGAAGGEVVADRDDPLVLDDRYRCVEVIEEADQIEAVAGL